MKIYNKITIIIISFISFYSCSNWKENLVVVEEKIVGLTPGLVYKASFPEKISSLLIDRSDYWIAGTMDGKFYKSIDEGKTWVQKQVLTSLDTIRFFSFITYTVETPGKVLVCSGTTGGIYISSDFGESWYKGIINGSTGNKVEINAVNNSYDYVKKKNTVYAYGWDGKNNTFKTIDDGKTWEPSITRSGHICENIYFITDKEQHAYSMIVIASSNDYGSYIINNQGDSLSFGRNNFINGIKKISIYILFAITQNGIYRAAGPDIVDNKWVLTGLAGLNVRSLCYVPPSSLYAGTDKGVYYSIDNGSSWEKLYFGSEEISVRAINSYKDMFYFLNDKGEVYYSLLPEGLESTVYPPILVYPKDNSTGIPVNTDITWSEWESKKENFTIQISEDKLFTGDKTKTIDFLHDAKYTANSLKNGTKYFWRVKSYNLFGVSNWTVPFSFTTE